MFSRFGRQIFHLYETHPIVMNSIVGGTVYVAGEYTVQTQSKDVRFFKDDNWKKLANIGALGAVENGVVMLTWYKILNKYVGSGVTTKIVLLKCLLDQLFFSTQQDFLFLGLCAYSDAEALTDALQEVKETFVTTWIVDCSLWPVVNFVGFAFIPYIFQPTYMAVVSYFWQFYLSTVAANDSKELTDAQLHVLFKALDTDNSNYIDAHELEAFFEQRNIAVTEAEIKQMIADADEIGRELVDGYHTKDDGKVSFEEFKKLATHGTILKLKSSALWCSVREDIVLTKGVKHAMKRLEELERHQCEKKKFLQAELLEEQHQLQLQQAQELKEQKEKEKEKQVAAAASHKWFSKWNSRPPLASQSAPPAPIAPLPGPHESAAVKARKARHQHHLDDDRAAAIHKATLGGSVLVAVALFRVVVFKL